MTQSSAVLILLISAGVSTVTTLINTIASNERESKARDAALEREALLRNTALEEASKALEEASKARDAALEREMLLRDALVQAQLEVKIAVTSKK